MPEPIGTLRPGPHRVLVTGVHRPVAAMFIARLLDLDAIDFVLAVDRGPCPAELIGHDPARFAFASADLSRRRQVDNLFLHGSFAERGSKSVVHLAFQGSPADYDHRHHEFNVNAMRYLLAGAIDHGVQKVVFLSSDAVYKLGPRSDFMLKEDAELNLDPRVHPVIRDTIDAEFLCRAKMDTPGVDVVVLRPSGVLGDHVLSGLTILFDSDPPILPIGFDPMVNPTTSERLARDLVLATLLSGKGVFNVAGDETEPLSHFLRVLGTTPLRVPGPALLFANRLQRLLGKTRYHAEFHPRRLYYSLVLDDRRFRTRFRESEAAERLA